MDGGGKGRVGRGYSGVGFGDGGGVDSGVGVDGVGVDGVGMENGAGCGGGRAGLGALALFACALVAALLPLPLSAGGGRPAWVDRFPRDPDAYVGIGRADKRAHPETFRELARDAALAQISREISVEVASTAASARREDAQGWEESYAARTATASRNVLTGHTLEGVYETQEEFWAYYALDKETFRAALDAKENRLSAWLEEEAAALAADLEARRLQAAADRYARILRTYGAECSGDAVLQGRASPLPRALGALSVRMREAVRGLRLASDPARWVYSPLASAAVAIPATWPVISLIDGEGKPWAGPYALILSDRFRPGSAPCRVETDADGRLDPAHAFARCGMEPGRWTVVWAAPEAPEGLECRVEVEAVLRKRDFGLAVSGLDGANAGRPSGHPSELLSARLSERLHHALLGSEGRHHRIVKGGPALPVLAIRVREAHLDSLDGIFFLSIRAEASFPGMPAPVPIRGKAGHADKERARSRAVVDLVRALSDADFLHLAAP